MALMVWILGLLGEYAAPGCGGGVLSLDDALKIVAGHARLIGRELARYIGGNPEYHGLSSCDDGAIAGGLAQLDKLQTELKASGRKCARVNVPCGYHSSAMNPVLDHITALASTVKLNDPTSTAPSSPPETPLSPLPSTFARHCGEPVNFE
ncbi:uncharacterized protein PHACADRAFT_198231 [Phanerochaete carnosa HHB-10118-sp]|uniref:Malonyl-CoA:ACP transacylase (MAT) domain-containing protein n=1 Tax=Phanerochaete carnosa (strain HHB-10118-sp) TaxID=650164 RepID=K5W4G0_PHACS|nr:uncharacterized protein PHACADRAFT_198231 [Phanerochaete carnosa HHB-10118-sp]EKM53814.1 hypothetical protein PHACADRAFT_198231 [Phanerochaete carnosa HHB-10118-sp]